MARKRDKRTGTTLWILGSGIAVGLAAAVFLRLRARRMRFAAPSLLTSREVAVVDALLADPILGRCAIDVAAVAPGIIELSGTVELDKEAHQAVLVAQRVPGVETVLNRLNIIGANHRLRPTPVRVMDPASSQRWYGMGVGMGRRRQSEDTDPPRRDDHADMLDEALAPDPQEARADLRRERSEGRVMGANEVS